MQLEFIILIIVFYYYFLSFLIIVHERFKKSSAIDYFSVFTAASVAP
jgi:hypothetical protein